MFGDQFYWARRVSELGVGTSTPHATMTADALSVAMERVLDPAVADRARGLASQISRDGARIAAERLESAYGGREHSP